MIIQTWLNYIAAQETGEWSKLPSLTIPDQSLTVEEIIRKFTAGQPTSSKEPLYDVPDYLPDNDALNLVIDDDNPDLLTSNQELYENIQNEERQRISRRKNVQPKTKEGEEPATIEVDV